MRKGLRRNAVLFACLSLSFCFFAGKVEQAHGQAVVTFQTEDGLTIYGTLHLPTAASQPAAGVIMFAEPEWIVRSGLEREAHNLAEKSGIAVLTVDHRGTGKSVNGKLLSAFYPEEKENLQLDVRGAIQFLSSQKTVDPKRLGIVAAGMGANYALLEALRSPAVQAVALISGSLSDRAREYIKSRQDVPILCVAGEDEREAFREMAEAFSLTKNKNSKFLLVDHGHGTVMFSQTKGVAERVAQWLTENVKGVGIEKEVSFDTEDSWSLHGRLRLPDGSSETAQVPGVAFVHGAQHDQDTYYELTKSLARKGIATLTFDWRGKNRDLNEPKGHYGVNLRAGETEKVYLDVKAAINYLASQKSVDANRIGLVGATGGSSQTLRASIGDARIKTIVILSQNQVTDEIKRFLTTTDTPIFFIASSEDMNLTYGANLSDVTREAYRLSKSKYSEYLLYDGAARGSEMLKQKDDLEPMIVRWLAEKLAE